MPDRTRTQVEFAGLLWTCPRCSQEDYQPLDLDGGNKYEHVCSRCATEFNGPMGRPGYLRFHGHLNVDPKEFPDLDEKQIEERKLRIVTEWLEGVKHPPEYIPSTAAELKQEKIELERRSVELDERIVAAPGYVPPTKEELIVEKAVVDAKSAELAAKIAIFGPPPNEELLEP
jgi:hypothetical protein